MIRLPQYLILHLFLNLWLQQRGSSHESIFLCLSFVLLEVGVQQLKSYTVVAYRWKVDFVFLRLVFIIIFKIVLQNSFSESWLSKSWQPNWNYEGDLFGQFRLCWFLDLLLCFFFVLIFNVSLYFCCWFDSLLFQYIDEFLFVIKFNNILFIKTCFNVIDNNLLVFKVLAQLSRVYVFHWLIYMVGFNTFKQLVFNSLVALVVAIKQKLRVFVLLWIAQSGCALDALHKHNTAWWRQIFSIQLS